MGKNIVLILSGGGSPQGNHYSQYLQTRELYDYYSRQPNTEATVIFGGGLTPANQGSLPPDVIRQISQDSDYQLIPGVFPKNTSATRENIDAYFDRLQSRRWSEGDRFVLFVTDHGNPNNLDPTVTAKDSYANNCITLWQPGMTAYPENACLSVMDLQGMIEEHIPATIRTNFVMTQCFSGGFHLMGYEMDEQGFPYVDDTQNMCGFTAAPCDTTASGCTSFVNEETYDGYERRMAEELTGRAVLDGRELEQPADDLLTAHNEAQLTDNTKDVSLRTSESFILQYLNAKEKEVKKQDERADYGVHLNTLWHGLITSTVLPSELENYPTLQADLVQRLELIKALKTEIQSWQRQLGLTFDDDSDILSLDYQQSCIDDTMGNLRSQMSSVRKKKQELWSPLVNAYMASFQNPENEEEATIKKFEFYDAMSTTEDNSALYTRMVQEDPSLASYQEYLNYDRTYRDRVLVWGVEHGEINSETRCEILALQAQLDLLSSQEGALETLQGQLRRLQTQMQVAAGVVGLVRESPERIDDLERLVACEVEATNP